MPKGQWKKAPLGARLDKLLREATEEDLKAIDSEIANAEARVRALRAAKEIVAEEVLNRSKGPATKPTQSGGKPAAAPTPPTAGDTARRIGEYLAANGPTKAGKLATNLGIDEVKLALALEDERLFERKGYSYSLTTTGFQTFTGKN